MRIFIAAVLLIPLPTALHAEPMTFDAALGRAASHAPELQGSDAGIAAAQSAAIAADRLPDPKPDLALKDFPVTVPDAARRNLEWFAKMLL